MSDPTTSSDSAAVSDRDVTVLGWTVPRPTGRWHQSIVVTSRHVWITPEISFTANESLCAAAAAGIEDFHEWIRTSGWKKRPQRCAVGDVSGLVWNEVTGWMRIAAGDDMIGAQIPDRGVGTQLEPQVKTAISSRRNRGGS